MRELSIEEKAKRYDEAWERARNLHKDAIDMGESLREKQGEQNLIMAKSPQLGEQKPAWSEWDEDILSEIIYFFEKGIPTVQHDFRIYVSWLKSIKDRYSWKPSDEQMKALHDLNITGNISYAGQGQELINVSEQE